MTETQINYWLLQEEKRKNSETATHNRNTENESKRHNIAGEYETTRHNQKNEFIDLGKLNETQRHNQVTEGETARTNKANEAIKQEGNRIQSASLQETSRHNQVTEQVELSKLANSMYQFQQTLQMDAARLAESIRHNQSTEEITDRYNSVKNQIANTRNLITIAQNKISNSNTRRELNQADRQLDLKEKEIKSAVATKETQTLLNAANTAADIAIGVAKLVK